MKTLLILTVMFMSITSFAQDGWVNKPFPPDSYFDSIMESRQAFYDSICKIRGHVYDKEMPIREKSMRIYDLIMFTNRTLLIYTDNTYDLFTCIACGADSIQYIYHAPNSQDTIITWKKEYNH